MIHHRCDSGSDSGRDLILAGISIVEKALAAEENGSYEQAISLYTDAVEHFKDGIKHETDESNKQNINALLQTSEKKLDSLHEKKTKKQKTKKQKTKKQKTKGLQQQQARLSSSSSSTSSEGGAPGVGIKPKKSVFTKITSTVIDLLNNGMDPDEQKKLSKDLDDAIVTESPNVRWDDVVGLEDAKKILKHHAIYPYSYPHLYKDKNPPPTGILLWGPNGTGKTYLAKALATEAKCTFFSVSPAVLVTKYQGDTEGRVRALFKKARKSPGSRAIIFIDEIDCLLGNRSESKSSESRIISQFFEEMRGLDTEQHKGRVLVIGATNYPEKLDTGVRQRFQEHVYIPLPDLKARVKMLKLHLRDEQHKLTEDDFMRLGEKSNRASGSDIKAYVDKVLREPWKEAEDAKQFISDGDFMMACEDYPNCALCTPKLSTDPPDTNYDCTHCGAKRMTMEEVECEKLKLRDVRIDDFERVLEQKPIPTVPASEVERCERLLAAW